MARLAYLGTPDLAVPPLRALVGAGHVVALVVTRPDRRRGRGSATSPSPVKAAALELGLAVTDRVADVTGAGVELGVVVAYGRLVPASVLEAVPMVNLHFSLLPRWRGAAPLERAILAGDPVTGVCVMALEATLDTGPLYACEEVEIAPAETLEHLRRRLVEVGSRLLVETLAGGVGGLGPPVPQTGDPTYAAKVDPAELELALDRPAAELERVVRLGRAWTTFRGQRLGVVRAEVAPAPPGARPGTLAGDVVATGDGGLRLLEVQPEGRRAMAVDDWRRGARPDDGEVLGAEPAGGR
ncbi:MAG TPA: methionyl-tRNA formyltransferase [Acidimicrobiales bacterium]|nr:methionyl-tRNA formyltransferase [Acidimicrobiales bacterium]